MLSDVNSKRSHRALWFMASQQGALNGIPLMRQFVKIAQTLSDIEACNLSGLHSATWKCIRDTFLSLTRKRMQLGLSSPTHPVVANLLLCSGYS